MEIFLALLAIVVVIVLWVIASQRKLVSLDELCGNALSQIGVQQNTRWDALTALSELTKNYSEHEYKTLMDTVAARQGIDARSTAADVEKQEDMITQALNRIMAVAEAYPDLKAQQVYKDTMDGVKQYEDNVRLSRMTYNDTVTKYNRTIRQIPVSFIAGPMGFKIREYLKTEDSKTQMPSMS